MLSGTRSSRPIYVKALLSDDYAAPLPALPHRLPRAGAGTNTQKPVEVAT
jgi:hypothetical protein